MSEDTVTLLIQHVDKSITGCMEWANGLIGTSTHPYNKQWLIITRLVQFQIVPVRFKASDTSGFVIAVLIEAHDVPLDDMREDGDATGATGEIGGIGLGVGLTVNMANELVETLDKQREVVAGG